jgi:hypothetical protein
MLNILSNEIDNRLIDVINKLETFKSYQAILRIERNKNNQAPLGKA